ncbi:hypothetical protein GOBAR_DD06193 [Gossypium barbadense]|nr:hypothetical protein GOBAR_DD06193 [Gossypium barbadense]
MTDQRWVAHLSDPPDEEDKTIASESSLHAALVGVMNPMPVDQKNVVVGLTILWISVAQDLNSHGFVVSMGGLLYKKETCGLLDSKLPGLLVWTFKEIFTEWMVNSSNITQAIEVATRAVKEWKSSFGNIFVRKWSLIKRLQGIQNSPRYMFSSYLQQLEARRIIVASEISFRLDF